MTLAGAAGVIHSLVFDLDGTLVDSAPDILKTLRQAVAQAGIRSSIPLTTALIGPPVREMLDRWGAQFTPEQADLALSAFRQIYDTSPLLGTLPYPDTAECLRCLHEQGVALFVATNKPETPTRRLLTRCFSGIFRGFCCADSIPGRRLDKVDMLTNLAQRFGLAEAGSVMIGDGAADIRAGKSMGWRTMAALYGYGSRTELLGETPDWLVASMPEVVRVLGQQR